MKQNLCLEFDPEAGTLEAKTDTGYRIDDVMTALFTFQLQAMKSFMARLDDQNATEQEKQEIKEHLYDSFNAGASNVLYLFAPDKELHPDLTVEAMKEAEDKYMYNHLNRETRRELDKETKGATKDLRDLKIFKGGK